MRALIRKWWGWFWSDADIDDWTSEDGYDVGGGL